MSDNENYVDLIDLNLSDDTLTSHDGRFENLDPGEYDFVATKAKLDTSRKGDMTLRITWQVLNECPMKGKSATQSYSLKMDSEFTRRRLKHLVTVCNVPHDEQWRFPPTAFEGTKMHAEVITHQWEDVDPKTARKMIKTGIKIVGEAAYGGGGDEIVDVAPAAAQAVSKAAPVVTGGKPVVRRNGQPQVR